MRRARKGLSPLVAAVVLISATIVGGMLVYQYFQNSVGKAQAMSEGVTVTGSLIPLSANKTLVSITVINNYDKPIKVTGATAIGSDGGQIQLTTTNSTSLPTVIEAGGKTTLIFTANGHPSAVSVVYEVDGVSHTSEPARLG